MPISTLDIGRMEKAMALVLTNKTLMISVMDFGRKVSRSNGLIIKKSWKLKMAKEILEII